MLIILVPLFVCLIGAAFFCGSKNPNLKELGKITFFVGLLWTVYCVSATDLHLFPAVTASPRPR
jgi:Na+/phosphate symporter